MIQKNFFVQRTLRFLVDGPPFLPATSYNSTVLSPSSVLDRIYVDASRSLVDPWWRAYIHAHRLNARATS